MSGVYPGTRTPVYRKLLPTGGVWHTLSWYTDPPSLTLAVPPAAPVAAWQLPDGPAQFLPELTIALESLGQAPQACFACHHWHSLPGADADGVPLGRCTWGDTDATASQPARRLLEVQSALSLACDQFAPGAKEQAGVPAAEFASYRNPDASDRPTVPIAATLRVPKAAELDPDRLPFWARLRRRVLHAFPSRRPAPLSWEAQLVERSGVGAGTEPCFVCQGRLANLGALAVACEAGDKQTFSIWRCRICHTLYLNDWIDRWERLDSLETEERYYRVAPAEAYAVLHIIHTTPGGDHPARRAERSALRAQILAMLQGRTPLSHQIRQGR